MPLYQFKCDDCRIINELKLTFAQHSAIKDSIECEKCKKKMNQVVAPLNFRLVGEGWFGRDGGGNQAGVGYEITQREMDKNKEQIDRAEEYADKMSYRDEQNLKAGLE